MTRKYNPKIERLLRGTHLNEPRPEVQADIRERTRAHGPEYFKALVTGDFERYCELRETKALPLSDFTWIALSCTSQTKPKNYHLRSHEEMH